MSQPALIEFCMEHCRKEDRSLVILPQQGGESKLFLGKGVFSLIDNPEWILCMVNIEKGCLVICPTVKSKKATRVTTNEDGIMEIAADFFITELCSRNDWHWKYQSVHFMKGKFAETDGMSGVWFNMKDVQELVVPEAIRTYARRRK